MVRSKVFVSKVKETSDESSANDKAKTGEAVGRWPLPSEVADFNQVNADIAEEITQELRKQALVRPRLAWALKVIKRRRQGF